MEVEAQQKSSSEKLIYVVSYKTEIRFCVSLKPMNRRQNKEVLVKQVMKKLTN